LAPAQALITANDERGVGAALAYALLLLSSVLRRGAALAHLDVEAHAPAAAPHAVVRLYQPGSRWPRLHVQWPDAEGTGPLDCRSRVVHGHCQYARLQPATWRASGPLTRGRTGRQG